eukprot:359921-Amphidinium_carterae.1
MAVKFIGCKFLCTPASSLDSQPLSVSLQTWLTCVPLKAATTKSCARHFADVLLDGKLEHGPLGELRALLPP